MKKLYQSFTFDLIIAISALVLGIIMLPPFGIGKYALDVLLAATIVAYFFVYIFDKLKRSKGSIFVLTVIECIVYSLIIIALIFEQFRGVDAKFVCRSLGLFFWVRGTSSAIGMYIKATMYKMRKNNLPDFLIRILMISFGIYVFANPFFTDIVLNWAMCVIFFLSALAFGGLAVLFAPGKKNKLQE